MGGNFWIACVSLWGRERVLLAWISRWPTASPLHFSLLGRAQTREDREGAAVENIVPLSRVKQEGQTLTHEDLKLTLGICFKVFSDTSKPLLLSQNTTTYLRIFVQHLLRLWRVPSEIWQIASSVTTWMSQWLFLKTTSLKKKGQNSCAQLTPHLYAASLLHAMRLH